MKRPQRDFIKKSVKNNSRKNCRNYRTSISRDQELWTRGTKEKIDCGNRTNWWGKPIKTFEAIS